MGLAVLALLSLRCGSQAGETSANTLVYFAGGPHRGEISLVNDEGVNRKRLAAIPTRADELAWSPDGTRLAWLDWNKSTDNAVTVRGSRSYIIEDDASATAVRWPSKTASSRPGN